MSSSPYQIVGFHFSVSFKGLPGARDEDARFQSISGLNAEKETETLKEGGENHYEHVLPGRSRFASALSLKRGLHRHGSGLTQWCVDAFEHLIVRPLGVVGVELLDEQHQVLAKWDVHHVWPKSWKVAELNAEKSEVLIETLELNYNRFSYKDPGSP